MYQLILSRVKAKTKSCRGYWSRSSGPAGVHGSNLMRYCFPPGLECQCGGLSGRREAQQAFALQTRAKRSWRTFVDNHYRVHCIYLLDSIGVSDYIVPSKMPHWHDTSNIHDMTTFTIPWGIAIHYISPKMTMIYKCLILLLTIELPTDCLLYRGMREWFWT